MSTSRVAQVRLRLRIPAELSRSATRVREHVERELVVQVLEQLELLLHRRFGAHTVIRIRRLALGWRIDLHELGERDLVERLAADLADQIIADATAMPAAERARPRGESFAIFDDDRHLDAVYLADAADGEARRWLHAERQDPAATWQELAQLGAPAIVAVVQWLRMFERLDVAIALATESTQAAIAALVPDVAPIVELVRARARADRLPAVVRARDANPHTELPTGDAPSPAVLHETRQIAGAADEPQSSPHVVGRDERAIDAAPAAREVAATAPDAAALVEPTDVPAAVAAAPPEALAIDTDAAGLFYLAGRVLEIDLAERLWAAGLPEGVVLAEIAAAILGTSSDRAVDWFGGAFDDRPVLPAVEAWAVAEVVDTVQHALGRRLAALGVALTPAQLDTSLDELAREVRTSHEPRSLVHRLVARSVASIAAIVAARLGEPPSLGQLRAVCMRPGRLVLLPDELHVVMSHHAIDLDHRRAGLDQDPGHVPWLGRRVRFEFVGGEVL